MIGLTCPECGEVVFETLTYSVFDNLTLHWLNGSCEVLVLDVDAEHDKLMADLTRNKDNAHLRSQRLLRALSQ